MFGIGKKDFKHIKLHATPPEPSGEPLRDFALDPAAALPPGVDLRDQLGPVENVGELWACNSAIAVAQCIDRVQQKRNVEPKKISRLFLWYTAREAVGDTGKNVSPSLRACIGATFVSGVAYEADWPFAGVAAKVEEKPPEAANKRAVYLMSIEWGQTQGAQAMKAALADGYPLVFRYSGPEEEFRFGEKTGKMESWGTKPKPALDKFSHVMLIVGYDDAAQHWIVRNAWGEAFGDKGHMLMPYDTFNATCYTSSVYYCGDQQTPKRALMAQGNAPSTTSLGSVPKFEANPAAALPPSVNLRPTFGPVEELEGVITCSSAVAVATCVDRMLARTTHPIKKISRLFLHYNANALAGRLERDDTPMLMHCVGAVIGRGFVPYDAWPTNDDNWCETPPPAVYAQAHLASGVEWGQTKEPQAVKAALADGYPVAFRFCGTEADYDNARQTGKMQPWGTKPAPAFEVEQYMLIVGYDDAAQTWLVRSCEGRMWGDSGYCTIPYDTMKMCSQTNEFFYFGEQQTPKRALMRARADGPSSTPQTQEADVHAEQMAELASLRKKTRDELADHLDDTKKSTRDRLRQMMDKPPGDKQN